MLEYKTIIYLITFSSYVGIHSLRSSYSFSKGMIAQTVSVEDSQLGIVDSLMLYTLALGFLQQVLFPFKNPVHSLAIGMFLTAFFYVLIPTLLGAFVAQSFVILCVLMCIDGYFQSYAWPNLLMLINTQYDNKKQAFKLGIWMTNTNVGNILGFVICQFLVLNNDLPWQMSMYIVGIYVTINSLFVFFCVKELPKMDRIEIIKESLMEQQQENTEEKVNRQSKIPKDNPLQNIVKLFSSPVVILMTLIFSLVKSIQYGILLWLPMYFDLIGLVQYSAYIPLTFDCASIVSSIALGYAFKIVSNKGLLIGPLVFVLMILFIFLRYATVSITGYFLLIAGVGLCLGGSYNTLGSLVAMQLVKVVDPRYRTKYLGFYSAVLMCVANLITATTQILIGYIIGQNEQQIFTIFFWYSAVALTLLIAVGIIERVVKKEPQTGQQRYIQIVQTH